MFLKKLDNDMEAEIDTIRERYTKRKEPILRALEVLKKSKWIFVLFTIVFKSY